MQVSCLTCGFWPVVEGLFTVAAFFVFLSSFLPSDVVRAQCTKKSLCPCDTGKGHRTPSPFRGRRGSEIHGVVCSGAGCRCLCAGVFCVCESCGPHPISMFGCQSGLPIHAQPSPHPFHLRGGHGVCPKWTHQVGVAELIPSRDGELRCLRLTLVHSVHKKDTKCCWRLGQQGKLVSRSCRKFLAWFSLFPVPFSPHPLQGCPQGTSSSSAFGQVLKYPSSTQIQTSNPKVAPEVLCCIAMVNSARPKAVNLHISTWACSFCNPLDGDCWANLGPRGAGCTWTALRSFGSKGDLTCDSAEGSWPDYNPL